MNSLKVLKVDQSNKITLSPSADDSQKLIDLALGGRKLVVEVTPYSASPATVEYDLAEFSGSRSYAASGVLHR